MNDEYKGIYYTELQEVCMLKSLELFKYILLHLFLSRKDHMTGWNKLGEWQL